MIKEYLPHIFILIGILNFIVFYYIRYQLNSLTTSLGKVIAINKKHHYDLKKFLVHLEDFLIDLQIEDYGYKIYFQNELIEEKKILKEKKSKLLEESVSIGEYKATLSVIPTRNIGEQKEKNKMVFNTLLLLIQENLHIKMESIHKSFDNISKFHTFILHDTKNIAQFFQVLSYNIEQCKTQKDKDQLLENLKESIDMLNNKSFKILKLLELNSLENITQDKTNIELSHLLQKLLDLYHLKSTITGSVTIVQSETLLYFIFENIFKNIQDKMKKEPNLIFTVNIEKNDDQIVVTIEDNGTPIKNIEKVFEPFYTTKEDGLGIGLYKVKTLLHSIGGTIHIKNTPNVTIEVYLPL